MTYTYLHGLDLFNCWNCWKIIPWPDYLARSCYSCCTVRQSIPLSWKTYPSFLPSTTGVCCRVCRTFYLITKTIVVYYTHRRLIYQNNNKTHTRVVERVHYLVTDHQAHHPVVQSPARIFKISEKRLPVYKSHAYNIRSIWTMTVSYVEWRYNSAILTEFDSCDKMEVATFQLVELKTDRVMVIVRKISQ